MARGVDISIAAVRRSVVAGIFVCLALLLPLTAIYASLPAYRWPAIAVFVLLWAGLTALWLRRTADGNDAIWGSGPGDYSIGPHTEYGDLVGSEQDRALSDLSEEEA